MKNSLYIHSRTTHFHVICFCNEGGDRNINLLPLDPLDIPLIHIEQGEESPVNVVLIFKNNTIVGLHDFEFYKIE